MANRKIREEERKMIVRDVMTWNVVTVSSDTPIMEARKIMETQRYFVCR
jgi:CBS domain-containing protein